MKKLIIIFGIVITLFISSRVLALTPTASPSANPTRSSDSKDIDVFKEKLASKVAELSKKNQKVLAGIVDSPDKKKFKLKTEEDGVFDIKVDEDLTKYYSISGASKLEKKISDLKKGVYVIVSGPQVDRTIDANIIYQDEQFLVDFGKVVEINKDDNSLQVTTAAKENYILDIEVATKQQLLDIKTLEFERLAFSKIKAGDSIHFVVKKDTTVKNRFATVRTLVIPQEYFISK